MYQVAHNVLYTDWIHIFNSYFQLQVDTIEFFVCLRYIEFITSFHITKNIHLRDYLKVRLLKNEKKVWENDTFWISPIFRVHLGRFVFFDWSCLFEYFLENYLKPKLYSILYSQWKSQVSNIWTWLRKLYRRASKLNSLVNSVTFQKLKKVYF